LIFTFSEETVSDGVYRFPEELRHRSASSGRCRPFGENVLGHGKPLWMLLRFVLDIYHLFLNISA
jgi:hypothetical protein